MQATITCRPAVVFLLLQQPGVDPNAQSVVRCQLQCRDRMAPLRCVCAPTHGAQPHVCAQDGLSALLMAAWWGSAPIVRLLMRHPRTDVNLQNVVGTVVNDLPRLARLRVPLMPRPLLSYAVADVVPPPPASLPCVAACAQEGLTALHKIAASGDTGNLVPELERRREAGHAEVIRLLLSDPRVDVNRQDQEGNTALMTAARLGKAGMVRTLLEHPVVDVRVKNFKGKAPIACAKTKAIKQLLEEAERQRQVRGVVVLFACAGLPFLLGLGCPGRGCHGTRTPAHALPCAGEGGAHAAPHSNSTFEPSRPLCIG